MIALAASTYPVAIRSTGVGWAMAIGRLGAVIGPILGGFFLSWHWNVEVIFPIIAAPALLGASVRISGPATDGFPAAEHTPGVGCG